MILFKLILQLKSIYKKIELKYYTNAILNNAKSVKSNLKVNGVSWVNQNSYLGENVNFNGMKIYGQGKVVIGNNFHSGTDCQMITQFHDYDKGKAIPYDSTYIKKDIIIENNVWLGNNVILLGGITIGEGAIIQAGSVVVSNIGKYVIAGGHPAKPFSKRDVQHYIDLKNNNKFH